MDYNYFMVSAVYEDGTTVDCDKMKVGENVNENLRKEIAAAEEWFGDPDHRPKEFMITFYQNSEVVKTFTVGV